MADAERLFGLPEYKPIVPAADRLKQVVAASRNTGIENALRDIEQIPHLKDKLASLALDSTIIIHGIEFRVGDLTPSPEH